MITQDFQACIAPDLRSGIIHGGGPGFIISCWGDEWRSDDGRRTAWHAPLHAHRIPQRQGLHQFTTWTLDDAIVMPDLQL